MNPETDTQETAIEERDERLGEIFEQARKSARLSIERSSELTHVSAAILAALEAGDYRTLPPEAFTRGIVQKYALLLGLNPHQCAERYNRESVAVRSPQVSGSRDHLPPNRFAAGRRALWLELNAAILVAGFGLFYLLASLGVFLRPPSITLDPPILENAVLQSASLVVAGNVVGSRTVVVNGQRIGADEDGRFSSRLELTPGPNTIELSTVNSRGKTTELTRRVIVNLK